MIIFINHLGFIFFISEDRFRIFDLKLEYEFFPCGYTSGYTSRGVVKEFNSLTQCNDGFYVV